MSSIRLAIAQLMAQQDHAAGCGEADRPGPDGGRRRRDACHRPESQYIAAADVLRQMHEYQLSQTYLERAKAAGASDIAVRIGLANNYLALGDTAQGVRPSCRRSAT